MSVSWFEFTKKKKKKRKKKSKFLRKQPIDEDKENMVSTTDSKDESSKYVLIL